MEIIMGVLAPVVIMAAIFFLNAFLPGMSTTLGKYLWPPVSSSVPDNRDCYGSGFILFTMSSCSLPGRQMITNGARQNTKRCGMNIKRGYPGALFLESGDQSAGKMVLIRGRTFFGCYPP